MYGHPKTNLSHDEIVHTLARFKRMATLISTGASGIKATELPLLYAAPRDPRDRNDFGRLIGRMALANDHWRDAETGAIDALVLLPQPLAGANWNFETIHATGKLKLFRGEGELRSILSSLSDREDSRRARDNEPTPADYIERQIGAIIGVEIDLTGATAKRRLREDQRIGSRATMLQELEENNERELAAAMREI